MSKEAEELAAEISKIDLTGGLAPAVTPAESPIPESKEDAPPKEPAAGTEPIPESQPKVEESAVSEPPIPEPKEDEPSKEPAADDRHAIPDSHYRAALNVLGLPADKAAEKIGALYDKDPELALDWLKSCYEQVNTTSKQLGELGRKAQQLREQPAAQPVVTPTVNRKAEVKALLCKEYEDSPALEALVDLIPDAPAPKSEQSWHEPAVDQQTEIERQVAVRQQINTFFTADEMGVYSDFYGKTPQTGDWQSLTPGQKANRIEVCNRAQMILDGAALTGMQMSSAEALERAHLEVAAPMAEQFVRERIVKSVQKRAAGVTLKPSGSMTPPKTGEYNHQQAIADVAAEIKKIGLG